MHRFIGQILIAIVLGIIIFVVIRFVWQRNEFGYIGADKTSIGYRYLMSWLDSWSDYLSWDLTSLSQTQYYFKRAIDHNRDTILGNTLANNMNKVQERSQLETIQQCVWAVRNVWTTRNEIDTSYDQLLALLQDQLTFIPTVLLSIKDLSTITCIKQYVDIIKQTTIMLVETSQSWGKQKQMYADEINNYPRTLWNCDKIMLIQAQSLEFKQHLATLTYQYNQYREMLSDPNRHKQLCQQQYNTTLSGTLQSLKLPTLTQVWDNVNEAIASIKSKMQQ